MQLFITNFEKKRNEITITNQEILNQIRKVLRMRIGEYIFVQKDDLRYKIKLTKRDDKDIFGDIEEEIKFDDISSQNGIAIAMSNKRDKMELIVQKLSEIGIKNIYFRPSERSIIRQRNEKKLDRLNKIAKEAIEQSRGWDLPKIQFEKEIGKIISQYDNIFVFDKSNNQYGNKKVKGNILGIIGPEGGLSKGDYEKFGKNIEIISLGENILRTETATIVAGWILANRNSCLF